MQSPSAIRPRSPCAASPGCTKTAGVPVEHMVVANLRATSPAFPIPVATTFPVQSHKASIARSKDSSTVIDEMASASAASRWLCPC